MKKKKSTDAGGASGEKPATKTGPKISEREKSTLLRLRRRYGATYLINLIESEPQQGGRRGTPRMQRTRQCFIAVLYHCRLCKSYVSIPAFAKHLERVIDIKYSRSTSRSTPPTYRSLKSTEADLRRGLRETTNDAYGVMLSALLWWRHNHGDPHWPFYASGLPHLLLTPKKPVELISWIDAAVAASKKGP